MFCGERGEGGGDRGKMPKIQYPPQAGEKRLCLSIFCTMMTSVMSAVAIIYSIVIIYNPSVIELKSNLQGPKMCTTVSTQRNLKGPDPDTTPCVDRNRTRYDRFGNDTKYAEEAAWSSCEEWCLSMVGVEPD